MGESSGRWLRVSSAGQDEQSQLPELVRWETGHGYTMAAEYTIHGHSAFKGNKTFDAEWARVLEDMRSGKITVLVVWKQNRLDRKLHTFQMLQQVVEVGGRVEFVSQPHLNDLTTMGGRIALKVEEEIAYADSKGKSDNVKIKQAALRSAGSAVGRAPWGYEIKPAGNLKLFVPTDSGHKYIPAIFARVIQGESLPSIAAWLTAEGVPTTQGKPWNEGYLCNRLIRNPVYYGARRNAGKLETEALVSASTWQEANAAVKTRARPGRDASVRPKALLAPICGECKGVIRQGCPDGISPMYRVYGGYGKNRQPYYRCSGHGPQRKGCGFMITVGEADASVTSVMLDDGKPHPERVFIPGDDKSDEIAKLRERGASAMREGNYTVATDCMGKAAELESLPRVKPHWEISETDQAEGDFFGSLDLDQRRDYLVSRDVVLSRARVVISLRGLEDPWA
jgi:DNA invertase Pin-like site-specific DNA recombinase